MMMKDNYVSKSSSFAKNRMREAGNTQYRPEQQDMCCDIRTRIDGIANTYAVVMEERIAYTKESGILTAAIVDIYIDGLGICYRLNGLIHNSNVHEVHDWEQKLYLEALGYLVIDVEM